jgi:hypothetical protein
MKAELGALVVENLSGPAKGWLFITAIFLDALDSRNRFRKFLPCEDENSRNRNFICQNPESIPP